jgi:hypothetical protein
LTETLSKKTSNKEPEGVHFIKKIKRKTFQRKKYCMGMVVFCRGGNKKVEGKKL